MGDVINIADHDNRFWTAADALNEALLEYEEGKFTKVLIIKLDNQDQEYNSSFIAANLKASEAISLIEVVKTKLLKIMGYI